MLDREGQGLHWSCKSGLERQELGVSSTAALHGDRLGCDFLRSLQPWDPGTSKCDLTARGITLGRLSIPFSQLSQAVKTPPHCGALLLLLDLPAQPVSPAESSSCSQNIQAKKTLP